jgi:hypothetical protein
MFDNEPYYQLSDWLLGEMIFASLVLLELKGLEEVKRYSLFSPLSLLVDKLISVERKGAAFLVTFLAAYSLFRHQLSFECIILFENKMKGKDFFPGPVTASKQALLFLCCLNLAIALQSAVFWLFL